MYFPPSLSYTTTGSELKLVVSRCRGVRYTSRNPYKSKSVKRAREGSEGEDYQEREGMGDWTESRGSQWQFIMASYSSSLCSMKSLFHCSTSQAGMGSAEHQAASAMLHMWPSLSNPQTPHQDWERVKGTFSILLHVPGVLLALQGQT